MLLDLGLLSWGYVYSVVLDGLLLMWVWADWLIGRLAVFVCFAWGFEFCVLCYFGCALCLFCCVVLCVIESGSFV